MEIVLFPGGLTSVALSNETMAITTYSHDTGFGSIVVSATPDPLTSNYYGQVNEDELIFRAYHVFYGSVSGLCYLPNGSLLACGWDEVLKVFSPSLELVQTLEGHNGPVECVTISPSGSHIASGGSDGKVMIWSESGEGGKWARVQVLEDDTSDIEAVCFSPDGKQLATGSWNRLINLYSFNEGHAILAHTLEGHTNWVRSFSFSPDCKLLCSGSNDQSIKFWNPADGSLVKSIDQAHTSTVWSVSYSPNGRILVSAGNDFTMKIWDAETFELKHTFEQEFITFHAIFTTDSNYIVSANSDHKVRFTPCREYHITCLTPILNLILHIVYKWEFVTFPKTIYDIRAYLPTKKTPAHAHTIRLLGECVHHGGYNVTSEIISFLSPVQFPIVPTRWKRNPEDIIARLRAANAAVRGELERSQEENAAVRGELERSQKENQLLRIRPGKR